MSANERQKQTFADHKYNAFLKRRRGNVFDPHSFYWPGGGDSAG